MTDEQISKQHRTAKAVLAQLKACGIEASYEYPGCIVIPLSGATLWVGTANGNWGCNLLDADGNEVESEEWDEMMPDTDDARGVADRIEGVYRAYVKPVAQV